MDKRKTRSRVYTMFSTLLQRPDRPTHKEIKEGKALAFWNAYLQTLSLNNGAAAAAEAPASWQPDSFPSYEEWRDAYNQAMPPVRPRLMPIESVYKRWTSDPSCEMPFANQTGLLQGDSAQHLKAVYKEIGFDIPNSFADCPDHLVLVLEFMAALVEEVDTDVQATFLQQHLDWIPKLIEDAEKKQASPLYLDLLRWLESYLGHERHALGLSAT